MHARYFSAHLGRFQSFDPMGGNGGEACRRDGCPSRSHTSKCSASSRHNEYTELGDERLSKVASVAKVLTVVTGAVIVSMLILILAVL